MCNWIHMHVYNTENAISKYGKELFKGLNW
jgi:hypothetical protein